MCVSIPVGHADRGLRAAALPARALGVAARCCFVARGVGVASGQSGRALCFACRFGRPWTRTSCVRSEAMWLLREGSPACARPRSSAAQTSCGTYATRRVSGDFFEIVLFMCAIIARNGL